MESLQAAAAGLLEMKRNIDRVEQEIRTLAAQKEALMEDQGEQGSDGMDMSEDAGESNKHLVSNFMPSYFHLVNVESLFSFSCRIM